MDTAREAAIASYLRDTIRARTITMFNAIPMVVVGYAMVTYNAIAGDAEIAYRAISATMALASLITIAAGATKLFRALRASLKIDTSNDGDSTQRVSHTITEHGKAEAGSGTAATGAGILIISLCAALLGSLS